MNQSIKDIYNKPISDKLVLLIIILLNDNPFALKDRFILY